MLGPNVGNTWGFPKIRGPLFGPIQGSPQPFTDLESQGNRSQKKTRLLTVRTLCAKSRSSSKKEMSVRSKTLPVIASGFLGFGVMGRRA